MRKRVTCPDRPMTALLMLADLYKRHADFVFFFDFEMESMKPENLSFNRNHLRLVNDQTCDGVGLFFAQDQSRARFKITSRRAVYHLLHVYG